MTAVLAAPAASATALRDSKELVDGKSAGSARMETRHMTAVLAAPADSATAVLDSKVLVDGKAGSARADLEATTMTLIEMCRAAQGSLEIGMSFLYDPDQRSMFGEFGGATGMPPPPPCATVVALFARAGPLWKNSTGGRASPGDAASTLRQRGLEIGYAWTIPTPTPGLYAQAMALGERWRAIDGWAVDRLSHCGPGEVKREHRSSMEALQTRNDARRREIHMLLYGLRTAETEHADRREIDGLRARLLAAESLYGPAGEQPPAEWFQHAFVQIGLTYRTALASLLRSNGAHLAQWT